MKRSAEGSTCRSRGGVWVCFMVAILVTAFMIYGCGGNGSSQISSGTGTQGGGGFSAGQTGTVVVLNHAMQVQDARAAETPTVYKYTGVDKDNNVVYGPVSRQPETEAILENVPVTVTLIHVDYCNGAGRALSTAEIPVTVQPYAVVRVTSNPVAGPTFSGALTMEVVNDSGLPDSEVYVLLSGTGTCQVDATGGTLAT